MTFWFEFDKLVLSVSYCILCFGQLSACLKERVFKIFFMF